MIRATAASKLPRVGRASVRDCGAEAGTADDTCDVSTVALGSRARSLRRRQFRRRVEQRVRRRRSGGRARTRPFPPSRRRRALSNPVPPHVTTPSPFLPVGSRCSTNASWNRRRNWSSSRPRRLPRRPARSRRLPRSRRSSAKRRSNTRLPSGPSLTISGAISTVPPLPPGSPRRARSSHPVR